MLISAQLVRAPAGEFVNVYEYLHAPNEWPEDPVVAFEWPMSLVSVYEDIPAGGNMILGALDVACPNEIDPALLYTRFREYAVALDDVSGTPPFVWPLPPVALRLWVQPQLGPEWKGLLMDLLRRILLP